MVHVTHSPGVVSVHDVAELQKNLKLIISGERDDLQHRAELTEDLQPHNDKTVKPVIYKHNNGNTNNTCGNNNH